MVQLEGLRVSLHDVRLDGRPGVGLHVKLLAVTTMADEVSKDGSEEAEEEEEEDGEEESSGELVPVVGSARPFALKQTSLHRAPTKASPPHVELLAVTPVSASMP